MIFNAIRESHDLQRDLCRKLTASRRDMAARQVLLLQFKGELMAHAAAEERHLYVPLLMDDGGLDASRHALHEHHEIDELLDELSVRNKKARWLDRNREDAELQGAPPPKGGGVQVLPARRAPAVDDEEEAACPRVHGRNRAHA